MRPSAITSPPVQPISASSSGTGSVRTTKLPKVVRRPRTGRHPFCQAFVATTISGARSRPAGKLEHAGADARHSRALVELDPCREHRTPERPHEPPRLDAGRVGNSAPRRNTGDRQRSASSSRESGTARSGTPSSSAARAASVDRLVLAGCSRDLEHPRLLQPDVLTERTDRRDRTLRRPGQCERALVADTGAEPAEGTPVRLEEPAVSAAGAEPDELGLDHGHVQCRVALLQGQRGPQPGVAAADDRDVGVGPHPRAAGSRGRAAPRRATTGAGRASG